MNTPSTRRRRIDWGRNGGIDRTIAATAAVLLVTAAQISAADIIHPQQPNLVLDMDRPITYSHQAGAVNSKTKQMTMGECQPCANGDSIIDDSYTNDDGEQEVGECAALATKTLKISPTAGEECRLQQLANYQNDCCPQPPRGVCSLCPDGGVFDPLTIVPSLSGGDRDSRTCSDLVVGDLNTNTDTGSQGRHYPFLDYLFTPGDCSDTLLQRSAAWCKCPGKEAECSLCPTGKRSSKSSHTVRTEKVFYGWDCDAFELVASWFTHDECSYMVANILEFDAPAFCGCEDSGPPPDICSLCGDELDNGAVLNPDEMLDDDEYSCQDLATSLRFIPNESTCDRLLENYHDNGFYETCCTVRTTPSLIGDDENESVDEDAPEKKASAAGLFRSNVAWLAASVAGAFVLLVFAGWHLCGRRRPGQRLKFSESFDL